MVGFISESLKQEEESGANQKKLKTSNSPETFRFDFEGYSSEFGGFPLASVEPFLEFDSIKDWIEEMQGPDNAQSNTAEVGSGICLEGDLETGIGNSVVDSVQGMGGLEKHVSVKVECRGSDEHMVSKDGIGGDNSLVKLDGFKDCVKDSLMKKDDLGSSKLAEINADGHDGDTKILVGGGDESDVGVLGDRRSHQIEDVDCSIEEGLEKVTLVGDEEGLIVAGSGMKKVDTPIVNENKDSDSESERETSSSSSASSSSSESDDDDDEEEEEEGLKVKEKLSETKKENIKQTIDMEEGQILDSDAENMVSWSEKNEKEEEDDDENSDENSEEFIFDEDMIADEDEDTVKGPIKSVNELKALPPVPPVNVTLQPCHQILPVGVVSSVLGAQVIVEGSEKHDPLNEGSILWIAEGRLPLGIVDEIFGPVKTPYYIVRYNSESEVPSGIQNGTLVGFVMEFVGHVLNDKNLYQKGYDASGENDEEVLDEFDFSDDEKEAEYKRLLKMSKRGNSSNQGQGPGNKKKNRSRGKTWTKDQPSASQYPTIQSSQPTVQPSQPRQMQQHMGPYVASSSEENQFGPSPTRPVFSGRPNVPSLSQGYQLGQSPMGPFFPRGPTPSPQQLQQAGFLLNGLLANGIPFQQQNMAFHGGFQLQGMPWMQQNHPQNLQVASASPIPWQQQQHISQMPMTNPALCQQPFDLSQLVSGNTATPLGPMNFAAGQINAPWAGMIGQNLSNQAPLNVGLQGPGPQLPAQQGQNCNSQPPTNFRGNDGASPQFSQGQSSGRGGRGRGRKPFHRRGGHNFGNGRGRQQPN
ncbi:H/ACA ribonucleoprotein complex non-core subunit NAF1-like isoform X2 [Chenopodium quinoa]|uniref:H/ACA ribonucleoprotein complex non-core subunit NAF1-like isoform X2 n=1 Tax=Chenopodium quinoa TaxID=63459 RepID=UPI000B771547|nr:H/ACA ribonucleoprotein complex non-core subunit NAF1-like isoform X2 [Chenopodium quinoa]